MKPHKIDITKIEHVDYKDVELLKQYLNPHGRIVPRKRSGLSSRKQREVASAIKRARFIGLLPFVER